MSDDDLEKKAEEIAKQHSVGSDFNDVVRYSMTNDGTIDLLKMQELEGRYGYNGGRGCDVLSGPCSCGAWH